MGVYGIHEITSLLGPARRVSAFGGIVAMNRPLDADDPRRALGEERGGRDRVVSAAA